MHRVAARLVKKLGLEKHPEGGYFRQTYESDLQISVEGYSGPRHAATAIYYLLADGDFSAFHRIKSDEIWHHYAGGPATLYAIDGDGKLSKIKIDKNMPQVVIKGNTWFAAALDNRKSYCLLGCTVSPSFHYDDFQLAKRSDLVRAYPQHKRLIERYTK